MTNREAQIFQWITENPMISQEELAAKAGIARSSAAVHISNLMKKGYILGKGYVTNGPSYCTVVGGANIDIGGIPEDVLVEEDSNSGRMIRSLGGVGRNIAHNLRLLGIDVKLITAIGSDTNARRIIESCEDLGIDITDSLKTAKADTATYLYITDEKGSMKLAVSDTSIYENLTAKYIASKMEQLNRARLVVLDTNIPAQTIEHICENCKAPVFASSVSTKKAERLLPVLDKLTAVVASKAEAEVLSGGIHITDKESLERVADIILESGVKNVFIDMENKGVYYACDEEQLMMSGMDGEILNWNGAKDAFMSGVIFGFMKHLSVRQMAKIGLAVQSVAVEGTEAINSQLCIPTVAERAKIEL
ncbi:MAG: winged helix-turn-helix transcriptional regulator [Lachnospiraceae bacterium]|nr:winged helix-turn-helix transcriptional regulator [Lachnospiraceae bacterium]